jgi:hypothetical protein
MAERHSISVMQEQIDEAAALDVVRTGIGDDAAYIERKLYYPYYRFDARCSVPTFFGRRESAITCLVDAVTGASATSDRFAVRPATVNARSILQADLPADAAKPAAHRYLAHHIGRALRVISDFEIRLDSPERVYKAFWIAGVRNITFMIDSMTGLAHPVGRNAA